VSRSGKGITWAELQPWPGGQDFTVLSAHPEMAGTRWQAHSIQGIGGQSASLGWGAASPQQPQQWAELSWVSVKQPPTTSRGTTSSQHCPGDWATPTPGCSPVGTAPSRRRHGWAGSVGQEGAVVTPS